MAALLIHVCVRTALAERSGGLEDASHEMGIGQTGVDLKKHKWGQAGRPAEHERRDGPLGNRVARRA
jgi:hypothetical protein